MTDPLRRVRARWLQLRKPAPAAPPTVDAYHLAAALNAASLDILADYEAASRAGDVRRRHITARRLDALRVLACEIELLHQVLRHLLGEPAPA